MKEIKYFPRGKDGEPSCWEGHVKMKIPRMTERLDKLKETGFAFDENGEVAASKNSHELFGKMLKVLDEAVIEMELKHKDSDEKVTCVEDLEYYREGIELINELGGVYFGGVPLGKS